MASTTIQNIVDFIEKLLGFLATSWEEEGWIEDPNHGSVSSSGSASSVKSMEGSLALCGPSLSILA